MVIDRPGGRSFFNILFAFEYFYGNRGLFTAQTPENTTSYDWMVSIHCHAYDDTRLQLHFKLIQHLKILI